MGRQPTKWENICAKHISDKGFVPRIYKELLKFITKKMNNPIKNGQKIWTDILPKKIFGSQVSTWKDAQYH